VGSFAKGSNREIWSVGRNVVLVGGRTQIKQVARLVELDEFKANLKRCHKRRCLQEICCNEVDRSEV
jgi:hypothetical protein